MSKTAVRSKPSGRSSAPKGMSVERPTNTETAVAQPLTINIFALERYVPEPQQSTRRGAEDFRKIQSRGCRT